MVESNLGHVFALRIRVEVGQSTDVFLRFEKVRAVALGTETEILRDRSAESSDHYNNEIHNRVNGNVRVRRYGEIVRITNFGPKSSRE